MVFEKLKSWLAGKSQSRQQQESAATTPPPSSGVLVPPPSTESSFELPRHLGDVWSIVQKIAEEEDPETFATRPVSEHAAETVEGKKDIDRWLQVYLKRRIPEHDYRFPSHHPRYRGFCLMARHWPSGTIWEAFDETTLLKIRVEGERCREDLEAALDAYLDEREGS